jgi:hypothetical protein
MTISDYIANRDGLYINSSSRLDRINRWLSEDQINACIININAITDEIKTKSIELSQYAQLTIDTSETIINGALNKIEFIKSTIYMLNSIKLTNRQNISIVDLTKGTKTKVIYSNSDRGIILESISAN